MTTLNGLRRAILPAVSGVEKYTDIPITTRVTSDEEYVCSVWCPEGELREALAIGGYAVNPAASLKYIVVDGRRVYEWGSWAYRWPPLGKYQHHLYYFPADDPGVSFHLHHHHEVSWMWSPVAHIEENENTNGDPKHVLRDALEWSDISFETVEKPRYG